MIKVFWYVTSSRLVNRGNSKDRCTTETSVTVYHLTQRNVSEEFSLWQNFFYSFNLATVSLSWAIDTLYLSHNVQKQLPNSVTEIRVWQYIELSGDHIAVPQLFLFRKVPPRRLSNTLTWLCVSLQVIKFYFLSPNNH